LGILPFQVVGRCLRHAAVIAQPFGRHGSPLNSRLANLLGHLLHRAAAGTAAPTSVRSLRGLVGAAETVQAAVVWEKKERIDPVSMWDNASPASKESASNPMR